MCDIVVKQSKTLSLLMIFLVVAMPFSLILQSNPVKAAEPVQIKDVSVKGKEDVNGLIGDSDSIVFTV